MPRHKLLVILILAALTAAALPAVAQAERTFKGPGYRTRIPSGWKIQHSSAGGWAVRTATAPHGANTLEARVGLISVNRLKKKLKVKVLPSNPIELVEAVIPLPPGATQAQAVAQPQVTTLAGAVGGFLGVHYVLNGQGTTMRLTAILRGNRVYLLDIISSDDLGLLGSPAIDLINRGWRWT